MQRQWRPLLRPAPSQPHGHGRVAFLPGVKVVRRAAKEEAAPAPLTVGNHIRKVRRERGLLQHEVAAVIGVSTATIANWEKQKTEPAVELIPAVIQFLGYEPWPAPVTLGERLRVWRLREGLTLDAVAAMVGVDERTWAGWEAGTAPVQQRHCELLVRFAERDGLQLLRPFDE